MQTDYQAGFANSFSDAAIALNTFCEDRAAQASLVKIAAQVTQVLQSSGKILIGGNGGSMADAMHFAEEWTGRFRKERKPFPALVLGGDPTHLSCVGNDYGFEEVFSRSVVAFAKPEDAVILLSTSGNSENLIRAARAAREVPVPVIGFLGKGGGKLLPLCDSAIVAPGVTSDRIQEIHMLTLHVLIEVVERALGVA
jgi:D-sedoheptulose 7-phosphate isomerase